jgi:anti-repressor protein
MPGTVMLFNEVVNLELPFPVNARTLHGNLQVGRDFTNWIKDRIERYGFIQGKDFSPDLARSTGGRPATEYWLTLNIAKQIAMLENNQVGQHVRQYLIQIEEWWQQQRNQPTLPATLTKMEKILEGYQLLMQTVEEQQVIIASQQATLTEQAPAVNYFQDYIAASGTLSFRQVAKILAPHCDEQTGQNRLIQALVDRKILFHTSTGIEAYQQFVDNGYLVMKTGYHEKTPGGAKVRHCSMRVTDPRGLEWLRGMFGSRKLELPGVN